MLTRPMQALCVRVTLIALLAPAIAGAASDAHAAPADGREIAVQVTRYGEMIIVDVDAYVQATPREAWDVLTDYDHMAQFVSNLESSSILSRSGNTLQVVQKGKASRGPLTFAFDNVREILLSPYHEIRSRLLSGNLKASDFITRVVDEGSNVRILNHGEFIADVWVPPVIGPAMIKAETKKQFGELTTEILRRKAQAHANRP